MIKFIRILLLVLIIIGIGLLATEKLWVPSVVSWILSQQKSAVTPVTGVVLPSDYKNGTYTLDGQSVTLANGDSEIAVPDSASKVVTKYFGNEAIGDLNGDSTPDVAFIVTQNSGGSGTFYYVVAAVKMSSGYLGTNAVLLGDRVAPQTTEIKNGQLIVNYADRKASDPMTAKPSVGVSKYLRLSGATLVAANLNADAYPLYKGIQWGAESAKVYEKKFSGYQVTSAPIVDITDLSAVSMPFDSYYKNKLESAGWKVDNALAAGGPGASITGYKKGSDYIIASYTTKFKAGGVNEPGQCPCDISFSVFSGSLVK